MTYGGRLEAVYEMFGDLSFYEAVNEIDSIEDMLYTVESELEEIFEMYYDRDGYLYEEKSLRDVAKKSAGAIGRLVGAAKNFANWLDSKAFVSLSNKLRELKVRDSSLRIDQDMGKIRKTVYGALDFISDKLQKFQSSSGYGKMVIPAASVLSWVPPFTPIPGADAMLISVSSVGDFLMDFKRRFKNQDYSAINKFNLWIQANMDHLSESDVYTYDKFIQRVANTVNDIASTIKKFCLSVNTALYKIAEVGGEKVAEKAKPGSKTEKIARKVSKTGKELGDDAKETLLNLKGYTKEKRFVKKGKAAVMKAHNEGYKNLSKKEFQTAQKFKKKYGTL